MRWLSLLTFLWLAGCASLPPPSSSLTRPAQAGLSPFALTGRISVNHDGERSSSGVHWAHRAAEDEILLLAPLGQTVARINRNAEGVALDTSEKHYAAADAGELTQQVLGWHLPLDGLRYWVLALPAPESNAEIERDVDGQISILRQDGWNIRYTRYAEHGADSLPLRLTLQRAELEIQLLIDEWEIQATH